MNSEFVIVIHPDGELDYVERPDDEPFYRFIDRLTGDQGFDLAHTRIDFHLCLVVNDVCLCEPQLPYNVLASYLYGGDLAGDVVLAMYADHFTDVVGFSGADALRLLLKLKNIKSKIGV